MEADGLILPRDPFLSLSACTYCIHPVVGLLLSCHLPLLPLPSTNAIPVRVPNEAQWECSLASSLQACSHPGIPKEFGWLGSLFLVPWVLAAPALMHHSHKHANVCNSPSLIHKKNGWTCVLSNKQTQNLPWPLKSRSVNLQAPYREHT